METECIEDFTSTKQPKTNPNKTAIPLLEMNGILGYDLMEIDLEHIDKVARTITSQYESDNFTGSKNKTKIIAPDEDTAWSLVARLKTVGLSDAMMPKIEVAGVYILDIGGKNNGVV